MARTTESERIQREFRPRSLIRITSSTTCQAKAVYDRDKEARAFQPLDPTMALRQLNPRVVHRTDSTDVITLAMEYFARFFAQPIAIPAMAQALGVGLSTLEYHFDRYRGRTTFQALIHYRLNRLCDAISHNPSARLTDQAASCGFNSVCEANREFIANFSQNLVQYRDQCQKVELWRQTQSADPEEMLEMVPAGPQICNSESRFHRDP